MAGLAIVLDLLKRNPKGFPSQSLHSFSGLSATFAASTAAAYLAAGRPSVTRFFFGDGGISIAYCDAAAAQSEDYFPATTSASEYIPHYDSLKYETKEYHIELKPLFSAFGPRSLAISSIRSFLLFYLPLLEPRAQVEEDDDFPEEAPDRPVDLVNPFQNSVKQIIRETTVVTTRRVLERLAAYYCSQRMVWKLLKDVSKSSTRKAGRHMPATIFCFSVARTTFRGHLLGVTASWIIQVGIEVYICFFGVTASWIIQEVYRCFFRESSNDVIEVEISENLRIFGKQFFSTTIRIFGKKVYSATVKCCASLIFASIGAGIGALAHPSVGQWIGCALGDFAGPIIAILCFEKVGLDL